MWDFENMWYLFLWVIERDGLDELLLSRHTLAFCCVIHQPRRIGTQMEMKDTDVANTETTS